jgi:hypothetical protein
MVFEDFRKLIFSYHFDGLEALEKDKVSGKKVMADIITSMKTFKQKKVTMRSTLLDYFFNISKIFNGYTKNPRLTYYLVLIPLGVIIHLLTLKKETFLNSKLFSSDLNVYKLIFAILIVLILYQFNLFD